MVTKWGSQFIASTSIAGIFVQRLCQRNKWEYSGMLCRDSGLLRTAATMSAKRRCHICQGWPEAASDCGRALVSWTGNGRIEPSVVAWVPSLASLANLNELLSPAFTSDDCDRRFRYGEVNRQKFDQSVIGFAFASGSADPGEIFAFGDFLDFFPFCLRFN
jgi:hypothetical protein